MEFPKKTIDLGKKLTIYVAENKLNVTKVNKYLKDMYAKVNLNFKRLPKYKIKEDWYT